MLFKNCWVVQLVSSFHSLLSSELDYFIINIDLQYCITNLSVKRAKRKKQNTTTNLGDFLMTEVPFWK